MESTVCCQIHEKLCNCRYLKLLQSGAHEVDLNPEYTAWLDGLDYVPNRERGQEYYTAPDGSKVKVRKSC